MNHQWGFHWTNGPFTCVAYDSNDDAVDHCGEYHLDNQGAGDCEWRPEFGLTIRIEQQWDHLAASPCPHELHPAECSRCRLLLCIHALDPTECERCLQRERIQNGEERQFEGIPQELADPEGSTDDHSEPAGDDRSPEE